MFLKMQQLACPSHFPLWLKIIFVLRSQGLLSCSVGAVIWQGSHLALLLLLSGPVVLLISCLHSSRAVSLPPEHGAFLEPWMLGTCREQELPQRCPLRMLTGWFVRPKSCGQEKGLGSAAGELHCFCSCAWVLHEHIFRRQLLCDDGQRKHCAAKWDQARWIAPVTQLQLLREEEMLDINVNRTCLKYLIYFLNALSGQSVKQKQCLQTGTPACLRIHCGTPAVHVSNADQTLGCCYISASLLRMIFR